MSKEPNNIDRLVREKLDGLEMTPPPSVWENTSASLNAGRKKRFFLWLFISFACIAVLGASVYFLSDEKSTDEQLALNQKTEKSGEIHQQEANEKMNSESDATSNSTGNETLDGNIGSTGTVVTNETNSTKSDQNRGNDFRGNESGSSKKASASTGSGGKFMKNDRTPNEQNPNKSSRGDSESAGKSPGSDFAGKDQSGSDESGSEEPRSDRGEDQTPLSDKNSDSDGKSAPNKTDDLANTAESGTAQNEVENSNLESTGMNNYSALRTEPVKPFEMEEPSRVANTAEHDSTPPPTPFWKSISVEASVGMSTFENQPKKSTQPSLTNAINAAASGQQSIDFRLGVNYHFTNRFSLQSGIHYNSMKENYEYKNVETVTFTNIDTVSFTVDSTTWDTTWITNTTSYDTTVIADKAVQNSYRIFTLPFQFAWSQPISTRGILEFSVGGAISIFGRNTGAVIFDNSNFAVNADSAYHTTGMLSLGGSIKYLHRFGMHHSAYIEPWAQFGVTNQSTPALNYESLRRRFGIRVGYRFYF